MAERPDNVPEDRHTKYAWAGIVEADTTYQAIGSMEVESPNWPGETIRVPALFNSRADAEKHFGHVRRVYVNAVYELGEVVQHESKFWPRLRRSMERQAKALARRSRKKK